MLRTVEKQLKYNIGFSEVDKESIELNTALPFNLYIHKDTKYLTIAKAGTIIDTKIYEYIKKQDAVYIPKEDKRQLVLSCHNLEEYITCNVHNAEYCLNLLYEINSEIFNNFVNSKDNKIDMHCITASVKSIIILIKNNKKFVKENISYLRNDGLLSHHLLHVACYAVYLGKALDLGYYELVNLGTAGYLDDIGMMILNQRIIEKDSALTTNEREEIQKHTKYSVDVAAHNHVHNPYVIDAIRHHHENLNGSGYPDGLKEQDINTFASVIAICDVFDALTSDRPYRDHISSYEALMHMMNDPDMEHKFNHDYIKVFIKLLVK